MKHILQMNATLGALAEPNRLQIVELLRGRPRPVGEIAHRLGLHQPQVSKHLKVLSEAGLVEAHQAAQRRVYSLRPKPFKELDSWLEPYRGMWEKRMDRLDEYLSEMKRREKKNGKR